MTRVPAIASLPPLAALDGRAPFAGAVERLRNALAELDDVVDEVRNRR